MRKRHIIAGLLFLFSGSAAAQINGSFSFGSIVTEGAYNTSFSGPLAFNGSTECLTLQNGVSVMMTVEGKSGVFRMKCRGITDAESKNVNVFPNPSETYTIIQSEDFSATDENVEISLIDVRGTVVRSEKVKSDALKTGVKMTVGNLASGLYLLKMSSGTYTQTFKIIKTGTLR